MAKKWNRKSQRDSSHIASLPAATSNVVRKPVVLVSDRRLYHPVGDTAPVYSPKRSQKRIVENAVRHAPNRNKALQSPKRQKRFKFSFAVPRKVELCVRRKQRREVMFALRKSRKGSRAYRRRRNYWSGVTCK